MTLLEGLVAVLAVLLAAAVALLAMLLVRQAARDRDAVPALAALERALNESAQHVQREVRGEVLEQARGNRAELAESVSRLARQLTGQASAVARIQNAQIDGFGQQLARLVESNERRLSEIRATLEAKLRELQSDNAARLDAMRQTVDERLHATLEQRLGERFRLVADQLEQVHRGLGEMQSLASDVGDLKRVLTNVKTRGVWGEVQLGALLEQMLVADQYAAGVATVPGSSERVEFAIRLPGRGDTVWLPVDAKFPREDWERLQAAHDRGDAAAADEAGRALEQRIRAEARRIRQKYVAPPHTTDFGLMFLPTEGLYAEVVRRAGLIDTLQREHRVVVAGPTTLAALLNSLQMGFRSLAVERRTSEVWAVLGAVKTEFAKFGDLLARTRAQLETVGNSLGAAETRSRAIERTLRAVESLPEPRTSAVPSDESTRPPS